MLIKVKVSDVAKDFGKQSKDIVKILSEYCEGPAKKPSTVLEEGDLNVLFDKITQENSVENFDAYFASRKPQEKKAEKKPAVKKEKSDSKAKKHQSQAAILQMAEQAAKYPNVSVVDGFGMVPNVPYYFFDGLHPNALGGEVYGENVAQTLVDLELV